MRYISRHFLRAGLAFDRLRNTPKLQWGSLYDNERPDIARRVDSVKAYLKERIRQSNCRLRSFGRKVAAKAAIPSR